MPGTILEEFINLIGWEVDQQSAQTAQQQVDQVFDSMKKGAQALTVAVTAPIIAFAAKSVQLGQIQRDAQGQLEAGLKSTENAAGRTLEQLQDMASGIQGKTLFGDENILRNVSANLITFTQIAEEQFDRAQMAALDMSTRMKTDLKSSTLAVGKALNDPIKNLSALGRSGIQFTKNQQDLIKSLAETNRMAEAQRLILDELEAQFGGSAEAAARTSTGWTQMSNAVGDLQERIGFVLIPIIKRATGFIQKIAEELQKLDDDTVSVALKIAFLAAAIGPLILTVIKLISVGKSLAVMWTIATTAITKAGVEAVIAQAKMLLIPIAIAAIIAALALLIQDFHVWQKDGESVLGDVFGNYEAFTKALKEEFQGLSDFIDAIIDEIVSFFYVGSQGVNDWVNDAKRAFNDLKRTVVSTFEAILNNPAVKAALDLLGIDSSGNIVSTVTQREQAVVQAPEGFVAPQLYSAQQPNFDSFGYQPVASSNANIEQNFNVNLAPGTSQQQAEEIVNIASQNMQYQYRRALNNTSWSE